MKLKIFRREDVKREYVWKKINMEEKIYGKEDM